MRNIIVERLISSEIKYCELFWYVINANILRNLKVDTVCEEIRTVAVTHEQIL